MKSAPDILPTARTWRDIPQQVKPRAMSKGGRRRMIGGMVRTGIGVIAVGALAWAGWAAASALQQDPQKVSRAVPATPIKDIVLVTDGVLEQNWLVSTLGLPRGATLMELDLFQLRERLLASGQVRTAVLMRNFPSTLVATLSERVPIVRVNAQAPGEKVARPLLVARDGVVFEGAGFDPAMLNTLPWLDGVRLVRKGDGFTPIEGMAAVADLIGKAKYEAEHLYRTWRVISLEHYASDGELIVRDADGLRIRFNVNDDFFRQLARLDLVLDYTRGSVRSQTEINLAVGQQVPVALAPEPAAMTGLHAGGRNVFPRPSPNQRKSQREF